MSDRGSEALDAEQAVEAKLAEAGADTFRRPEAAPEGTPAEPARNELGQFTVTETEQTGESAEVIPADSPIDDPAVAAYLAKYGGDKDAAVKAAAHLTGKLGQQAVEIGDQRRLLDELSRLTETIQADRQQPAQMDQATVDWYDEQVMQNPQQALEWARQQGNDLLVQRGLSVWKDLDPYGASTYRNDLQNQALYGQLQQQMAEQARLPLDATVNLALQNVRNRNPQFANYDDALEATLVKHPFAAEAWKQASSSGDPAQIEGAIETLYSLAVGDTLQTIAQTPVGVDTTTQDVVTPSVSETRDPAPQPSPEDKFREAFRQESERRRLGAFHVAD